MATDQAQGLRQWMQTQQPTSEPGTSEPADTPPANAPTPSPPQVTQHTLMVVGLRDTTGTQVARVRQVLIRWASAGRHWVGDPDTWKIVPIMADSPHLPSLAQQQARWGLWVDDDLQAFRRAHETLKHLEQQGPRRLILLHPQPPTRGLVPNICAVAKTVFDTDLLMVSA